MSPPQLRLLWIDGIASYRSVSFLIQAKKEKATRERVIAAVVAIILGKVLTGKRS